MLRTSDLRIRDVINVVDGKRLGQIGDFEVDLTTGQVQAVVICGPYKWLGIFGRSDDLVIPWERVIKFGLDVILVEITGC